MRPIALITLLAVAVPLLSPIQGKAQRASPPRLLFLTYAGLYNHTSLEPAEQTVTELGAPGRVRCDDPSGLPVRSGRDRSVLSNGRVPSSPWKNSYPQRR